MPPNSPGSDSAADSVVALLAEYRRKGIKLWADHGKLKFKAPDGALTPELKQNLRRHKQAILAFFEEVAQSDTGEIIPRRRETRPTPLSFGQQGLWFLNKLRPGENISTTLLMEGPLDVGALEQALDAVTRQHDILRTSFQERDGVPLQVIASRIKPDVDLTDLQDITHTEAETDILVNRLSFTRFQLDRAPLLKLHLLRLNPREHLMMVVMHHIISDGWSISVLMDGIRKVYTAIIENRVARLPDLPLQYADYAAWQRGYLTGELLEEKLLWWREYLAGAPEMTTLLTDRTRRLTQDTRGRIIERIIPGIQPAVAALSRETGSTVFIVLLSAFYATLYRVLGQDDLTVGTPLAGRRKAELEPMIGYFINMLVLRGNVSGNPTFAELLDRVCARTLEAYDHQEVPFDQVVDAVSPNRSNSFTPLFQISFGVQNMPPTVAALPALSMSAVPREQVNTPFDINFMIHEEGSDLKLVVEYNSALFLKPTLDLFCQRFTALVRGAVDRPRTPVDRLPVMDAEERLRLIEAWNLTDVNYPDELSLGDLTARQAQRSPEAPAVIYGSYPLTYGRLNRRANQLVHYIAEFITEPGQPVGLLLEPGIDLAVAILAVVKAGAAYVPMDPDNPAERLSHMITDTGMRLLLSHSSMENALPEPFSYVAVSVDNPRIGDLPDTEPHIPVDGRMTAYIMYTSGSTGKPKGTVIPHRAVTRLVWQSNFLQIGPQTRMGQIASVVFDAFTLELWGPLLNGGTMVGADRETRLDAGRFAAWLRDEGITDLFITVALFNRMVSERPDIFATIQTLMSGGEAPDHHAIRTCLTHGAPKRFLNVYGPTENTTFSTWRLIELLSPENAWIPMGEPITNSTAYVLDHLLEPVGLGMPGELCLGGDGLADGYLNRPALTAEKFVPHPFSREPGERLYRSGDLVTIKENAGRPDFIFLNRLDSQVKLRGLRIELGEIEAALENIDGVVQAAVLLRREDDKRLVAYLVATDVMDLETIKTALRRSLPDYMIPAVFVPMDALPITANGKLDRRALPAPNPADTIETSDYIAPKTPTQESLATCWAELLGLPRVSISANFFDLGGHSLLATRVLSFIRANFKTELSLEFFFANPTVEAVADQIDNQGDRTTEDSAVHPVPRDAGDLPQQAQPLSFSQQRLWFLDRLAESGPARIGYNMPALLLLQGHLDTAALESSLTQLTAAHESLRTTFSESNGKPRQVIHKPAPFPLPLIDLTGLGNDAEAFSRDLAVKTARQQFDLERGPLFKAALVRLGERRHLLLLCQHHIISDGWSVTLMVRETARRYRALTKGEFLELPFRAVQYADFAAWQRSPQRAEVLAGELTYWKQNLSGAPTLPALPADRFRPAVQTNRGAALAYRSGPQLQEAVNRLARDCDVTPFMVLEAAFALLLQMYSGQDDLCVGTPVANRNRAELEPILGFFVNTLVIRNDLAGVDSFRDLLTRTKSIALGAFAHQDVPFELIVETLQPERSRAHSPLFQVMFALQNQPDAVIHMPGLSMEPITVPHTTTMFDLTLSIFQTVEGMRGRLEYSTDLFDESTIARLAGHYTALLEAVTARPDSLPSAGQLADEAEKRALLNAGQAPEHSRPVPIHHTLARLAETTPEAPAMAAAEDPQDRVDYRTLQALVEALARRLHAAGIGSERVVALAMNRSTAALVAQLAVWRAGGAVVCLELTLPEQRVRNILTDSGAVLILAEQATADQVMTLGPPVLLFGDVFARARDIQLPEVEADSRLAYLIYTSGTTGTPKGVAVSRTALASHCAAMVQRYELTDKDIILQFAAFGFDASLEQWLPGLSVGARIVTRGRHLWSVESLLTQLANHRITVANLPPALWTELLTMLPVELPHLRMLILGGEALPVHGLKPWFSTMGGRVRLLNAYGPTETVITATTHLVPAGHDFARVPIGDALPGRRVYVLDERGALTPFGIPGQLAIGGHLMARGYLKLPARTAGVFVPDPFSTRPGARLYLTGDRVRRLQDHSLDFLGRVDRQVKLRGFRIEPGEIEAVLVSSPLVARAAVLLHTGLPGGDILAAYVIPGEEPDDNFSTRLHAHLAQKLPPYMIPASFQTLETIPMTPGGKVDRRALRQMVGKPDPAHRIQVSYTAPSSRLEATLAEIWEDILS
ncbi:MAG: amino acid adenylation domain-containing protein, partial [Acidobacteriota bacterium]|nr:amino acid adenylation domain-containing protein [Acidobacteriota bacterium]